MDDVSNGFPTQDIIVFLFSAKRLRGSDGAQGVGKRGCDAGAFQAGPFARQGEAGSAEKPWWQAVQSARVPGRERLADVHAFPL